ncbi:hypothetical protein Dimus_024521 [Dionaea muscipula]
MPNLPTAPGRSLHGAESMSRCHCPIWLATAPLEEEKVDAARSFMLLMAGRVGAWWSCLHRQPLLQLLAGDEAASRHRVPLLAEGSLPAARRGVPLLVGWRATARSPHVRGRRAARHAAYCPQPVAAPSDHTTSCMEKRGWLLQEAAPAHWMYNPVARMPSWQHV